ncbi:MAG: hypothetical protein ABIQ35_09285 [Verrucomicrobiota bacterium]
MTEGPQAASWKKRWWMIALAVVALAGLVILYFVYQPDLKSIHTQIASLHWLAVLLLVAILPIFGFSVALCYVIIGARFGVGWGLVVIALATVVHLLGSHWIANSFLRTRIEAFIARKKYKLPHVPDGENASISLMTSIIPGLPYVVRNYLLALAGIPLKTYFWVCWPVYVFRSFLTILATDFSGEMTTKKWVFLGGVLLFKIAICAYLIKRLRDKSALKKKLKAAASERDLPV